MSSSQEKLMTANLLLTTGDLFVHLDPRRTEVICPTWLQKQSSLVLQFGIDMAIPIRDLRLTELGISGTLSFNQEGHYCMIPWETIYAMVGSVGKGRVWLDDMPQDVLRAQDQEIRKGNTTGRTFVQPMSPSLTKPDEPSAEQEKPTRKIKRVLPSYMRVIK